jgi:hypothetical protein
VREKLLARPALKSSIELNVYVPSPLENPSSFSPSIREHRRVHCTSGRVGDCVDLQLRLLQYPVQHPPGKCPVRAAALQRNVN